jgi:hypothetical protein
MTSFQTYVELAADRTPDAACALIRRTVEDVVRRAAAN